MSRRLPPLSSLRAFEAAARHLSFKEAAEELLVTPAAVSQQVKSLEEFYGIILFRRLTRALELTEAGQRAAPVLTEAFDRLASGCSLIQSHCRNGPFALSVPPSFGAKWLVPRLGSFRERHPEIEVRIDADTRLVQFDTEDIDAAIRYGTGRFNGVVAECLMEKRVLPVCSPGLLAKGPPLRRPADLRHHVLLHQQTSGSQIVESVWADWVDRLGLEGVDPTRGPRFSTHSLVVDAAVSGQGVALADTTLIERELETGQLVCLFDGPDIPDTGLGYYLVYPRTRADSRRLRLFRTWLFEQRDAFRKSVLDCRCAPADTPNDVTTATQTCCA